jgi:hypothetical protein
VTDAKESLPPPQASGDAGAYTNAEIVRGIAQAGAYTLSNGQMESRGHTAPRHFRESLLDIS